MTRRCRRDLLPMDVLSVKQCRSSSAPVSRRIVLGVAPFLAIAALASQHSLGASATTAPIEQLYAALQTVMNAYRETRHFRNELHPEIVMIS